MLHDGGWADLTICNLSSRGLMAKCADPPPRGTFVEVRRGTVSVIGQVRWVYGGRLGIRAQEPIDISGLLCDAPTGRGIGSHERRADPRVHHHDHRTALNEALEEHSRRWSRLFDWMIVAAVGAISAGVLVGQVYSTLSAPLAQASAALAG